MNERPPQFIEGSALIICTFAEVPIGTIRYRISGSGSGPDARQGHKIIRKATFDEYLATVKPRNRDWIRANAEPGAIFYEAELI